VISAVSRFPVGYLQRIVDYEVVLSGKLRNGMFLIIRFPFIVLVLMQAVTHGMLDPPNMLLF
jgi:hypothetical protein